MASGEGVYNLGGGTATQSNAGRGVIIGELGRGTMNVSNTGTLTAAGTIRICLGADSSGAFNIFFGGTVNAPGIEFGAGTNNSVNFDRSDSLSFTSPITGAGYVTKTGTGTVTFTRDTGYTLGTTVNEGTLIALGLANNASNTITVNSGGTFAFNRNDTFGNHGTTVLTPIVINDGGTVRNNGNFFNTLGAVTLSGGTLQSIGSIPFGNSPTGRAFSLKGDITVGGSNTSTIAGPGFLLGGAAVTGTTFNVADGAAPVDLLVTAALGNGPSPGWWELQASSLTKTGAGNMQLEGTNTYSGNTTVGGGTLTVGGAGQLGAGNYNGDILISNGATFVQASLANQTLGGVISGGGDLVKTSTGTLTLDGTGNTYTGTTTIDGGTLLLNVNHAGAGTYTVNNGGTLGGIGSTTADVIVNSGGTIAPGNSPGILTVGDFTLNTGGTLNIFLDGGISSLLQVTGNVNLLGGGVNFTTLNPLTASLYTFVQYTGNLSNVFASANVPAGYELVYGDDMTIFLAQTNVAYPVSAVFNGTNAVITGGTLPFEVAVYNSDSNNVTFWATNGTDTTGGFGDTDLLVDDSTNVAGLSWTGTNVGANQTGDFAVTFSNGVGTNQVTNVSVTVSVYDHAAGSLATNAITNLDAIVGYTGALGATILASNAAGFRAPLGTTSTSTNTNLVVTDVNDVDFITYQQVSRSPEGLEKLAKTILPKDTCEPFE
jgi:fibronectin-binding autotransporter adhesin